MVIQPAQLKLVSPHRLHIAWTDGEHREYSIQELRDRCPCATCREKRQQTASSPNLLPVISIQETQPLSIQGMKPVGSYAYGIHFSDGHDTGIYTLELLRELGEVAAANGS